jgi:hypothetical protein
MTSEPRNQQDSCASIAQDDVASFESMTKHPMVFTAVRASARPASVKQHLSVFTDYIGLLKFRPFQVTL